MSARLFIVEGPDCSGKSTFAQHLAIQRNGVYIHARGGKTLFPAMMEYHQSLLAIARANLGNGHDVIMDRFWPSELVYGQILRPAVSDHVYDFTEILRDTGLLDPTYIFCDDPNIVERHSREMDGTHPYKNATFEAIVDKYRELTKEMMDSPALPLLHHPKTPPSEMKFQVRRYSLLEEGQAMGTFVDSL